jgi:hypothetical protein
MTGIVPIEDSANHPIIVSSILNLAAVLTEWGFPAGRTVASPTFNSLLIPDRVTKGH